MKKTGKHKALKRHDNSRAVRAREARRQARAIACRGVGRRC